MFTEPKIILSEDLSKRGYLTYYFNGKRQREYNGSKLQLDINPNYCRNYNDRLKLLKRLSFEFIKALEAGWTPLQIIQTKDVKKSLSLKSALEAILSDKLESDLSKSYKTDLSKVIEQFLNFVPEDELQLTTIEIDHRTVERFLNQFNSSATYYMNKRRALNVFFSELHRTKLITENPVQLSLKKKSKAILHKIYSKDQLKAVLDFLKENYPNLHLCCLLTYGCFLRPHQESRLLSLSNINDDFSKVTLAGNENKSKRIRVVNIPHYVQAELKNRIDPSMNQNTNVLSRSEKPFNVCYLNTQWSRAKVKMLKLGLIQKDQTIYSFRHTAVVNVYRKTKDLQILQQLLQHSNMIVTLNYLRGLGEINDERLRDVLPEL